MSFKAFVDIMNKAAMYRTAMDDLVIGLWCLILVAPIVGVVMLIVWLRSDAGYKKR